MVGIRTNTRTGIAIVSGVFLVLATVSVLSWRASSESSASSKASRPASVVPTTGPAHFVGAQACSGCHAVETAEWKSSQHAKAMQHATEATVLGNFNGAEFTYNGVVSRFFRRDGKFFVNTDGPDGKLADFELRYTFGVDPLQQYLVEFPDGRMQALSIAWDTRPEKLGGQRWYHLYQDEQIGISDSRHWTRRDQNWNWMCADCHSTKLERNFNASANTYATTWKEINVACEACHGPASKHVAWAGEPRDANKSSDKGLLVSLDERKDVSWLPVPGTGNALRSMPLESHRELGVCSQCHSRRAPFAAGLGHDGRLLETHDIALLTDRLYFPDGQQHDEVYNTGSFLQSKMHAQSVTCSDCHNPHSGELRAQGNAVCAQCHAPAKYDAPRHSLHALGSKGAECASCHMPTRDFMGIDARHDHSFRIPRPDLNATLGTPDACTGCHKDRDPQWAAGVIEASFGPTRKGFQTFGPALHAGRNGAPGAAAALTGLAADRQAPAIARASALSDLRAYLTPATLPAIEAGLGDPDPMVRGAALDSLLGTPAQERARLAFNLVDDPNRIVRIKAARVLAVVPSQGEGSPINAKLEKAFAEYVASQQANADRPEAHVNLGLFYAERRDAIKSEAAYRAALKLEPDFVPAFVNLADLYRRYGREDDAVAVLDAGLLAAPSNADIEHALGLARIRQGRHADGIVLLDRAARDAPLNARYAYVLGIALHDSGRPKDGIAALEQALARFPQNIELLSALANYAQEAGNQSDAKRYSARLKQLTE